MRVRIFRLPTGKLPNDLFYIPCINTFYMPFTQLSSNEAISMQDLDESISSSLKTYQTFGMPYLIDDIADYEIDITQPTNIALINLKVRPQDSELIHDTYSYYELLYSQCIINGEVTGFDTLSIIKQISETDWLCVGFTNTQDYDKLERMYSELKHNKLDFTEIGINNNSSIEIPVELSRL